MPSMDGQHVFRLAQTDFVVTLRCPGARYESCREGECNLNVVDMFGVGGAGAWAGSCRIALVVSVMPRLAVECWANQRSAPSAHFQQSLSSPLPELQHDSVQPPLSQPPLPLLVV